MSAEAGTAIAECGFGCVLDHEHNWGTPTRPNIDVGHLIHTLTAIDSAIGFDGYDWRRSPSSLEAFAHRIANEYNRGGPGMAAERAAEPRTFVLRRTNDVSGVSGLGDVAEGVTFSDGTTVLRWLRAGGSTAVYDSLERMEAIHGHDGGTAVFWLAAAPGEPGLREAAQQIASLSEDDIRDYEQGLCFFCGAGHDVIPGPRGGVTGERRQKPRHEATCSYVALNAALAPSFPSEPP